MFVDDEGSAERLDPAEFFGTHESLAGRSFNRPQLEQLENWEFMPDDALEGTESKRGGDRARQERRKTATYRELGVEAG